MGREGRQPANAAPDSGAMGFRYPEEPVDGRPVIRWSAFWESEEERLAYERAVREIRPDLHFHAPKNDAGPRDGQRTWLGMARLCEEIVTFARGISPGIVRPLGMPARGWSQRRWAERQWAVKKAGGHAHFEEPAE